MGQRHVRTEACSPVFPKSRAGRRRSHGYDKEANTFKGRKGGRSIINGSSGGKAGPLPGMRWRKAMGIFLEDLYIVWRACEGLPVWPDYYAAKLGYAHGGRISVNAPKRMTINEALATVAAPWEMHSPRILAVVHGEGQAP